LETIHTLRNEAVSLRVDGLRNRNGLDHHRDRRCNRSGVFGDFGSVVNENHLFFSDFFLFGDHLSKSLKINSPLGFHFETGIVFNAATIVATPALPTGS
jgi:hypothetical protein